MDPGDVDQLDNWMAMANGGHPPSYTTRDGVHACKEDEEAGLGRDQMKRIGSDCASKA